MDERYEGWSNRESWAANLWMENTRDVYDYVVKGVTTIKPMATEEFAGSGTTQVENFFRKFFTSMKDKVDAKTAKSSTMYALIEIGSVHRINFRELAEHWIAKTRTVTPIQKVQQELPSMYRGLGRQARDQVNELLQTDLGQQIRRIGTPEQNAVFDDWQEGDEFLFLNLLKRQGPVTVASIDNTLQVTVNNVEGDESQIPDGLLIYAKKRRWI